MLMEFTDVIQVSKLWFKKDGETPLEERRLRILDGIAGYMSQLSAFSFDTIGTPVSRSISTSSRHLATSRPRRDSLAKCEKWN
jgi:hypothetical protein